MEFCGRCGTEFDRSLERGRFCAACGHENPGNARYPLYADGAAAGASSAAPAGATTGAAATAVALPRVPDAGATRVRMSPVPAMAPAAPLPTPVPTVIAEPTAAWRTTLLASLVALLVLVLLGAFLLRR